VRSEVNKGIGLIKVFLFGFILSLLPFIIEQCFRIISSRAPWPFIFGAIFLVMYFLIAMAGIIAGRVFESFSFLNRYSKFIAGVFILGYLLLLFLGFRKNIHNPWLESYWIFRLGLIAILIILIIYHSFIQTKRLDFFAGGTAFFLWLAWTIFSPAVILPRVNLYYSQTFFPFFDTINLMVIAYLLDLSWRKIKLGYILPTSVFLLLIWLGLTFLPIHRHTKKQADFPENISNSLSFKPNLIFIVLDSARKDHFSLYGYNRPTSPFLEKFAQGCLVFTNAQTTAPWTLPAHASLFTGLYPHEHGAHHNPISRDLPLESSHTTLAEVLKSKGYHTAGISANFAYVTRKFGIGQGFDYFFSSYQPDYILCCKSDLMRFFLKTGLMMRIILKLSSYQYLYQYYRPYPSAIDIIAKAKRWLSQNCLNTGSPCFLFLNLMEAHFPYLPPPKYLHIFSQPLPVNYWGEADSLIYFSTERVGRILSFQETLTDREKTALNALYDEEIFFLDAVLKDFIGWLEDKNLFNNSLIVITSDHGELLGEKNLLKHGLTLYREELAVPLLVKTPFSSFKGTYEQFFTTNYLFNYIIDCLEEQTKCVPAQSFKKEYYLAERFGLQSLTKFKIEKYNKLALFASNYKVILNHPDDVQVFDLNTDPTESKDIKNNHPELVEWGENLYQHIFKEESKEKQFVLSPEAKKRLRALGYLR